MSRACDEQADVLVPYEERARFATADTELAQPIQPKANESFAIRELFEGKGVGKELALDTLVIEEHINGAQAPRTLGVVE